MCVFVCVSSPGGVYASMEVCTTSERLLDGMGTATFLSTCRASTACTASVWTSETDRQRESDHIFQAELQVLLNVCVFSFGFDSVHLWKQELAQKELNISLWN